MRHAMVWSLTLVAAMLLGSPLPGQETQQKKLDAPAQADQDAKSADQESEADDAADEDEELTPSERFEKLVGEYTTASRRAMAAIRKTRDKEKRAELIAALKELRDTSGQEVLELVEQVEDADKQAEMLVWVANNLPGELASQATERLLADYLDSPAVGMLALRMSRVRPGAEAEQKLRSIIERSNNDTVKGQATYALVGYFVSLKRFAELDDEIRERVAKSLGEETMAYLDEWTPEKIDAEIESLLESCIENYPDVELGQRKLGEIADNRLFALKNLQIGKVAPDIEGVDLDGEEFKLSDYRGKIVVLDFWGDW